MTELMGSSITKFEEIDVIEKKNEIKILNLNMSLENYFDQIYETQIIFSEMAKKIILSKEFQRLKYIRQLSACHKKFKFAVHTRYEHSIGVYYLTGVFLSYLKNQTNYFTDKKIELIKIAGLLHDIGHLAFSHLFDNECIPIIKEKMKEKNLKLDDDLTEHEHRARFFIESIQKNTNVFSNNDEIDFVFSLICPDKLKIKNEPDFIYQIIANKDNEIDTDKIDYLLRDQFYTNVKGPSLNYLNIFSNAKIYEEKEIIYNMNIHKDICNLFLKRYYMYQNVYQHQEVLMFSIIIKEMLRENIDNLKLIEIFQEKKIDELTDKYIEENVIKNMKFSSQYFSNGSLKLIETNFEDSKYFIVSKIGLCSNKKFDNPILVVNFFDVDENNRIIFINEKIKEKKTLPFISNIRSLMLIRNHYYKDKEKNNLLEIFSDLLND